MAMRCVRSVCGTATLELWPVGLHGRYARVYYSSVVGPDGKRQSRYYQVRVCEGVCVTVRVPFHDFVVLPH